MINREEKILSAEKLIKSCLSKKNGVFASPDRYKYQCWTRDLSLAVAPLLLEIGEERIVYTHLKNLSERQRENGQIPILFISDEEKWVKRKKTEKGKTSFMLGRYEKGEIWNITPGTKDSEILYIIAMYEYANKTKDFTLIKKYKKVIDKALNYIEKNNIKEKGLTVGSDWRDTMEIELADKELLTNNSLLYKAYSLMSEDKKAKKLKSNILKYFWKNDTFMDYLPDGKRPDPLGMSLAVLNDVIPEEFYPKIKDYFKLVDTEYGTTVKCIHNAYVEEEDKIFKETEGIVVWPFVSYFSTMALWKMNFKEYAKKSFLKIENLDSFYEWYNPKDGKGWGAPEQLWSATLYLRMLRLINNKN